MRTRRVSGFGGSTVTLVAMLLAVAPNSSRAQSPKATPASGRYHVVGPQRPIAPGERVELKIVPAPSEGTRVQWTCSLVGVAPPTSQSGIGLGPTVSFLAPFAVRDRATVRVTAGISGQGFRESASIDVELSPGSIDGAEDCLGPGQSFLADRGGIDPSYTALVELPEAIRRVQPGTPNGALHRGAQATVMLSALVCQSGRVIAAVDQAGERLPDPQPPPADRRLVEAAIQAVMQWEFRPGRSAEGPVATWIAVPFRFGP